MRKVPEPQRQCAHARAGSRPGSAAGSTSFVNSSCGLRFETTARASQPLAVVGDDADRAALLHEHLATGAAGADLDAARRAAAFAIAWVIAPMPPMAWPQAPFLPFTSPNTWCSST